MRTGNITGRNITDQKTRSQKWSDFWSRFKGFFKDNAEAYTGKYQVDQQQDFDREMADYQWDKDLEMWNMQNEYNSPEEQMERYKAAGLNPNLIYGQGQQSSGNASQLPKYSDVRTNTSVHNPGKGISTVVGALGRYQDYKRSQASTDQVKANTQLTHATARLKNAEAAIKEKRLPTDLLNASDIAEMEYQSKHADNELKKDQKNKSRWETDHMYRNLDKWEEGRESEWKEPGGRLAKYSAEADLTNLKAVYQKYENVLAAYGYHSHDHPAFKAVVMRAHNSGMPLPEYLKAMAFANYATETVGKVAKFGAGVGKVKGGGSTSTSNHEHHYYQPKYFRK